MSVAVDVTDMRSDTSRHSTVWLCIVAVGRKSQKHLSTFYVGQSFVRLSLKLTHFFFLLRGELEADRKQEQKKNEIAKREKKRKKKTVFVVIIVHYGGRRVRKHKRICREHRLEVLEHTPKLTQMNAKRPRLAIWLKGGNYMLIDDMRRFRFTCDIGRIWRT